jgi:hypothetical protein
VIAKPDPDDERKPKLLIMDRTPLSVLSNLDGALDWLFVPGCDVWMTDMVLIESRRPGEPSADRRSRERATFDRWFATNKHLIRVVSTEVGKKYTDDTTLWEMAGRPEHLRPSTANLGEASVLDKIKTSRHLLQGDEAFLVLMDDRDGREALKVLRTNADLMSTQTFVQWIAEDFKIKAAETAWVTLERMLGEDLDPGPAEDPVYLRTPG